MNFNRKGIKITSLSKIEESINNIPGAFQPAAISLMMGAAQVEREHIKERTRWGLENARQRGKKLGRPSVTIDFSKIHECMEKYNLKEKQAIRVCGYSESSVYKAKKKMKESAKEL